MLTQGCNTVTKKKNLTWLPTLHSILADVAIKWIFNVSFFGKNSGNVILRINKWGNIVFNLKKKETKTENTRHERRCPRRLALSPLAYPEEFLVPPVHVPRDIDPPVSPGSGHPATGSERGLRGVWPQNQPPESGEGSLPSLAGAEAQTQPDLGERESWGEKVSLILWIAFTEFCLNSFRPIIVLALQHLISMHCYFFSLC